MSVASEITRLQTAKANLKTSIENKGVTVPSSATLDAFATLVDQISGGGYESGTFEISSTTSHILSGHTGSLIFVIINDYSSLSQITGASSKTVGWLKLPDGRSFVMSAMSYSYDSESGLISLGIINEDCVTIGADSITLNKSTTMNAEIFPSTYKYIIYP